MSKTFLQRARRRGANAIEFALTLPLFVFMIFGVIDYGYLMMAHAILDAAAMEGTREGAITDPNRIADIATVAEVKAEDIAAAMCAGDCSYTCVDLGDPPEREVQCDLRWDIDPIMGFVPYPTQIRSRGRQLLEWQRAR